MAKHWIVVGCIGAIAGAVAGAFAGIVIGLLIARLVGNSGFEWGPSARELEVILDSVFVGMVGGSVIGLKFASFVIRKAENQSLFALSLTILVVLCLVAGFASIAIFNTEQYDDGTLHFRSEIIIPWSVWVWFFIAASTFVMLIARAGKSRRSKNRLRRGLCGKCGYDLRATIGRCPECGTQLPLALQNSLRLRISAHSPVKEL